MVALNPSRGTSIAQERSGYSRGLILGLTMAETMLLLVFCLLLLAGAVIAKKDKELQDSVRKATTSDETIAALRRTNEDLIAQLREAVRDPSGAKLSKEDWRELVMAKDAVRQLEKAGLTIKDAVEMAPVTVLARDSSVSVEELGDLLTKEKGEEDILNKLEAEKKKNSELGARLQDAEERVSVLEKKVDDLPPIIDLSEAKGYSFEVSSAELKSDFKRKLVGAISDDIASIVRRYDVDIIEVIGHTDEQRLSRHSNMDVVLGSVLKGESDVGVLLPGDNAGLGLARAISVAEVLKGVPALSKLNILPMSGGQLILPDEKMTDGFQSGDAPERRRIEIRVRKSKEKLRAEGKI